MVECLLHQLEIASLAKQLCAYIMPKVMEAEILNSRFSASSTPL
jgi:hypothetical protein